MDPESFRSSEAGRVVEDGGGVLGIYSGASAAGYSL